MTIKLRQCGAKPLFAPCTQFNVIGVRYGFVSKKCVDCGEIIRVRVKLEDK